MEDTRHLQFVDACENIDAAVFTGDTLYNPASLGEFAAEMKNKPEVKS